MRAARGYYRRHGPRDRPRIGGGFSIEMPSHRINYLSPVDRLSLKRCSVLIPIELLEPRWAFLGARLPYRFEYSILSHLISSHPNYWYSTSITFLPRRRRITATSAHHHAIRYHRPEYRLSCGAPASHSRSPRRAYRAKGPTRGHTFPPACPPQATILCASRCSLRTFQRRLRDW